MSDPQPPATAGTQVPDTLDVHRLGEHATAGASLNTRQVTSQWSALRDRSDLLHGDIEGNHHEALALEHDARTTALATGHDTRGLVDQLAAAGLSWALIARLVSVSPTAVRKWRRGEPTTAANRRATAKVLAALELVDEHSNPLQDPATWLEMPISDLASVSPADLLVSDRLDLLLDLASGRLDAHAVLDAFDPGWREHFGRNPRFRTTIGDDGHPVLVER